MQMEMQESFDRKRGRLRNRHAGYAGDLQAPASVASLAAGNSFANASTAQDFKPHSPLPTKHACALSIPFKCLQLRTPKMTREA